MIIISIDPGIVNFGVVVLNVTSDSNFEVLCCYIFDTKWKQVSNHEDFIEIIQNIMYISIIYSVDLICLECQPASIGGYKDNRSTRFNVGQIQSFFHGAWEYTRMLLPIRMPEIKLVCPSSVKKYFNICMKEYYLNKKAAKEKCISMGYIPKTDHEADCLLNALYLFNKVHP